jgi:hypothetical protein
MDPTESQLEASAYPCYTTGPSPYYGFDRNQHPMRRMPDSAQLATPMASFDVLSSKALKHRSLPLSNPVIYDLNRHKRRASLTNMTGQKRSFMEEIDTPVERSSKPTPDADTTRHKLPRTASWNSIPNGHHSMSNISIRPYPVTSSYMQATPMNTNKALPMIPMLRSAQGSPPSMMSLGGSADSMQCILESQLPLSPYMAIPLSPLPEASDPPAPNPRDSVLDGIASPFDVYETSADMGDSVESVRPHPQPQMFTFKGNQNGIVDNEPQTIRDSPKRSLMRKFVNKFESSYEKCLDRLPGRSRQNWVPGDMSGSWVCHSCGGEPHSSRKSLEAHANTRGCRAYGCEYNGCNSTFSTHDAYKRHSKSHKADKDYPCPCKDCDRNGIEGFTRKDALYLHIKHNHSQLWDGLKQAYPKYCSEPGCKYAVNKFPFDSEREFVSHLGSQHGKGKFDCLVVGCKKTGKNGYSKESDRDAHMAVKHLSEAGRIDNTIL